MSDRRQTLVHKEWLEQWQSRCDDLQAENARLRGLLEEIKDIKISVAGSYPYSDDWVVGNKEVYAKGRKVGIEQCQQIAARAKEEKS